MAPLLWVVSMSTLCAGCGHDSITAAIIEACYRMELPAHRIAKVSGIGCSSKSPTYFLGRSLLARDELGGEPPDTLPEAIYARSSSKTPVSSRKWSRISSTFSAGMVLITSSVDESTT